MKQRRIFFLHPKIKCEEDVRKYIKINEKNLGFEFVWDEANPDYLFVSECFYTIQNYEKLFFNKRYTEAIKIFFSGECIEPDLNLFDYSVVFNKNLKCEDRIGRIPLVLFYFDKIDLGNQTVLSKKDLENKKYFCNFIYSNANAHPKRDELFHVVSKYKKVDSLGKHLNNTNNPYPRESENWKENSIKLKSGYKFSISAENAMFQGYTSEKIMTSFLSRSIPIYWGNPLVDLEFNSKAFINAGNFDVEEELLEFIKRIDNDNNLWLEMINEPWQTKEQIERSKIEYDDYKRYIQNIFLQSKIDAKRCGEGTFPSIYTDWCNNRRQTKNTAVIKKMSHFLREIKL